jgi:hypothetical protein
VIHELRVTDKQGLPVELGVGMPLALTVEGESFRGRVASSDAGGAVGVEFDEDVYAAYVAARKSKRPGGWFRSEEVGG